MRENADQNNSEYEHFLGSALNDNIRAFCHMDFDRFILIKAKDFCHISSGLANH